MTNEILRFDRLGDLARPIDVTVDLHATDKVVLVRGIDPGPGRGGRARLTIDAGPKINRKEGRPVVGFLTGATLTSEVVTDWGQPAEMVIDHAGVVDHVARNSVTEIPLEVGIRLTNTQGGVSERKRLLIRVLAATSRINQPRVDHRLRDEIRIEDVAEFDGTIVVGQLEIANAPPERVLPGHEPAYVAVTAQAEIRTRDPSATTEPASSGLVEPEGLEVEFRRSGLDSISTPWVPDVGQLKLPLPNTGSCSVELGVSGPQLREALIAQRADLDASQWTIVVDAKVLFGPKLMMKRIHRAPGEIPVHVRSVQSLSVTTISESKDILDSRLRQREEELRLQPLDVVRLVPPGGAAYPSPRKYSLTFNYRGLGPAPTLDFDIDLLVDGETVVEGPGMSARGFVGGRLDLELPVSDLFELCETETESAARLGNRGEIATRCRVRYGQFETDEHDFEFVLVLPLRIQKTRKNNLICVDVGTSSTAIYLVLGPKTQQMPHLGDWFALFDSQHDESPEITGATESYLLPSHIGLSSHVNFRVLLDPLSLGDLHLAALDDAAIAQRLAALERHVDVSVPFPDASRMADHLDEIVFEPKKLLMSENVELRLGGEIRVLPRGRTPPEVVWTNRVNLEDLLLDVLDELGGYVLPRVLAFDARHPSDRRYAEPYQRWIEGVSEPHVVLTHPGGISKARYETYKRAGARFLRALGAEPADPDVDLEDRVTLVAEALAAARFGIQNYCSGLQSDAAITQRFITLDIGAGTYDVSVIDASIRNRAPEAWKVRSHFGIVIGGSDLDREIAKRVAAILAQAAREPGVMKEFRIIEDLPSSMRDLRDRQSPHERKTGVRFLQGIQAAKADLTKSLLNGDPGPYRMGANVFKVLVGRVGKGEWPVSVVNETSYRRVTEPLELQGAQLRLVEAEDGAMDIYLDVQAEALQGATGEDEDDNLTAITELLGQTLPEIAWCEAARLASLDGTDGEPPVWIVTGRAALWPPLFDMISTTISRLGPSAGRLTESQPFSAELMKTAVLTGASMLAVELNLERDEDVNNRLAIIRHHITDSGTTPGRGSDAMLRGPTIQYIDRSDEAVGYMDLTQRGRLSIGRALPGLGPEDEMRDGATRYSRLISLGIQPWQPLGDSMFLPEEEGLRLHWRRIDGRLTFTVRDERNQIVEEVHEPIGESRIFLRQ